MSMALFKNVLNILIVFLKNIGFVTFHPSKILQWNVDFFQEVLGIFYHVYLTACVDHKI